MGAGACGGAADTDLFNPGGTSDGGGGGGDGGGGGGDAGTGCDPSQCGLSAPSGFTLVAYAGNQDSACPAGWTSTDARSDPAAQDGACSCDCNVSAQPDCGTGTIIRKYDYGTSATCGSQGATVTGNSGGCSSTGQYAIVLATHIEVDPPPPTGGTCSFDATPDPKKVSSSSARVCQPEASCTGALCKAPAGYAVCVATDGDVACPSGFPTKHLVGGEPQLACSGCGTTCAVSADCQGTLTFYTDANCSMGKVDMTADGTCGAKPVSGTGYYYSYSYTGTAHNVACGGAAGTPKADVTLAGARTVCCRGK